MSDTHADGSTPFLYWCRENFRLQVTRHETLRGAVEQAVADSKNGVAYIGIEDEFGRVSSDRIRPLWAAAESNWGADGEYTGPEEAPRPYLLQLRPPDFWEDGGIREGEWAFKGAFTTPEEAQSVASPWVRRLGTDRVRIVTRD